MKPQTNDRLAFDTKATGVEPHLSIGPVNTTTSFL